MRIRYLHRGVSPAAAVWIGWKAKHGSRFSIHPDADHESEFALRRWCLSNGLDDTECLASRLWWDLCSWSMPGEWSLGRAMASFQTGCPKCHWPEDCCCVPMSLPGFADARCRFVLPRHHRSDHCCRIGWATETVGGPRFGTAMKVAFQRCFRRPAERPLLGRPSACRTRFERCPVRSWADSAGAMISAMRLALLRGVTRPRVCRR